MFGSKNNRTLDTKTRKAVMVASITVLCFFLSWMTPVNAALFYTGDVHIESLSATINVTDQAEVTVRYTLVNRGAATEEVGLSVSPAEAAILVDGTTTSNPVIFSPGQQRELALSYSMELFPSEFQRITFNPMLFFNNMASAHRIDNYTVQMVLPEGITRIISASKSYDDSKIENGRLVVTWQEENVYPSALNVSWTTLEVAIAAIKKAQPETIATAGEVVNVEITIQNQGEQEVRNLKLIDSFFPGAFAAVDPLDDFELVEPEMSDPHLYWEKEIDYLAAGETRVFSYSIEVRNLGLQTRLDPLTVLVNDTPVAASNELVLYDELTQDGEAAGVGLGFPWQYIVIGSAVAGAVGGIIGYRRRKRKAAAG